MPHRADIVNDADEGIAYLVMTDGKREIVGDTIRQLAQEIAASDGPCDLSTATETRRRR